MLNGDVDMFKELMEKIDIKSAFRLILVHPAEKHLLAMAWRDSIYVDTFFPCGLCSAPKSFNIFSSGLLTALRILGSSMCISKCWGAGRAMHIHYMFVPPRTN